MAYDKEDDVFFVSGGGPNIDDNNGIPKTTVWKFKNPEKFNLTGTSHMKKIRAGHGCGIFRSKKHNGRPLLVTAGSGWLPSHVTGLPGTGHKDCEYFDYTKDGSSWQLCSKSNSSLLY